MWKFLNVIGVVGGVGFLCLGCGSPWPRWRCGGLGVVGLANYVVLSRGFYVEKAACEHICAVSNVEGYGERM